MRERSGHNAVTQERSMLRFMKAIRKGSPVGILIDLTLKMNGFAHGRLEIASPEAVEQCVCGEKDQPQSDNSHRMVMEVVVGVPLIDQLVEALILNLPSTMTIPGGDNCRRCQRLRQRP